MRSPIAVRRERAAYQRAFEQMTGAQEEIVRADGPAGRARVLREFAGAARECAVNSGACRAVPLRAGSGRCMWTDAAVLAEAAAYSEQWLAEGRLEGTLPGGSADFGGRAERDAWVRVFSATGAADRRRAYLDLAVAAEQRTNTATVSVLRVLSRAYLAQMPYPGEDDEPQVAVIGPRAVS